MSNTPGISPITDDIEDIRHSDPDEREIAEGSDAGALDDDHMQDDSEEDEGDLGH